MANEKNLRSFNAMNPEAHRQLSSKGGKASGEARRAKRAAIEAAKAEKRAADEMMQDNFRLYFALCKKAQRIDAKLCKARVKKHEHFRANIL